MATLIALLRGTNIGGNRKLPMKALSALLVGLGFYSLKEHIFGRRAQTRPGLDAICRSVEINLRDSLGEEHDLAPLQPVNYCLL